MVLPAANGMSGVMAVVPWDTPLTPTHRVPSAMITANANPLPPCSRTPASRVACSSSAGGSTAPMGASVGGELPAVSVLSPQPATNMPIVANAAIARRIGHPPRITMPDARGDDQRTTTLARRPAVPPTAKYWRDRRRSGSTFSPVAFSRVALDLLDLLGIGDRRASLVAVRGDRPGRRLGDERLREVRGGGVS